MFRLLFERSTDPIWLYDPKAGVFVDCNRAAVELMRCGTKESLLRMSPADLSPPVQPDGRATLEAAAEITELVERTGNHRFEWLARRADGTEVPLEVAATQILAEGRFLHVVISRDITERKQADEEIRLLNQTLERRIAERTAELSESEARLRTLVENAPEAIVVFDGDTGRFVSCNENATRLYGLGREQLTERTPADVSPPFQPDGRPSQESACEKIQQAMDGNVPVFEWTHRHASGRLVPCEVRLVRLPCEGRNLIRGSIIDNTERRRRENVQQATFEISEAVHTTHDLQTLYERIHSIIQGLMPAANFYIALYDPATELISFPYYVDEFSTRPEPRQVDTGLTGYVLRTGKALLVDWNNTAKKRPNPGTPDLPRRATGRPAAIWLGVPLSIQGRLLGVMAVQDYHNEKAYGEEEKQILAFVAAQTALAIGRKRAEQALLTRAEQMRRHRNVLLELAQMDKSNLQTTLEIICARAAETLGAERVGYWSLDRAATVITCELLHHLEGKKFDQAAKGIRVEAAACPAYFAALAEKKPIMAADALHHPNTRELAEGYLRPLGIASMLDMPVWLHGRVVGVLCHEHVGGPREWTAEEIDFASSLATMVSLSIEAAQRARSEQALRESEQKFRALFETSSQGVMLHDDEQFLEVNPATVRMLGYERAGEMVGKHPADFAPPTQPNGESSKDFASRQIAECMRKGSARFEWVAIKANGDPIPLDVILTRVETGGRQLIQAVIDDISERKKAEAELLKALAREKELSALKSSFVTLVSHEFRTPLGIIMSSAEILAEYLEQLDPEDRRQHLQSIQRNTRRMADLMEEVLLLGRFEAGRMEFRPAPLDLAAFCRKLTDEVLSATGSQCPVALEAPEFDEPANADDRLMRHIFINLLSNAVKYSEPGVEVRFSVERDGAGAVFRVSDQGIGIPKPDMEWLFNAFHRGRNVGSRPGTGLGLVIVKRCVELHGGRIRAESEPGRGTVMTVWLPVFRGGKKINETKP